MSLPWPLLAAGLTAGLAGGLHCAGMCGGIVTALSCAPKGRAEQRIRFSGDMASLAADASTDRVQAVRIALLTAATHTGRIASYMTAGALAGAAGTAALSLHGLLPVRELLYLLANLAMLALGLYLLGATRLLGTLERQGQRLWARIKPLLSHLLPVDTLPRALAAGVLWGWMPCGLVYGALGLALIAGGPIPGALVMLAFGLGTLPHLLAAGLVLRKLGASRREGMRRVLGSIVLGMALLGLWRWMASGVLPTDGWFCL